MLVCEKFPSRSSSALISAMDLGIHPASHLASLALNERQLKRGSIGNIVLAWSGTATPCKTINCVILAGRSQCTEGPIGAAPMVNPCPLRPSRFCQKESNDGLSSIENPVVYAISLESNSPDCRSDLDRSARPVRTAFGNLAMRLQPRPAAAPIVCRL